MKFIPLILLAVLFGLGACTSKQSEETQATEVQTGFANGQITLPPRTIPTSDAYDPDLLVPHYSRTDGKWGYISRESREVIVPYLFWRVSRMQNGYGLAIELLDEGTRADIFYIGEDGTWRKVYEGKPGQTMDKELFNPYRTVDGFFYTRQGKEHTFFNRNGEKLWDTLVPDWKYFQSAGSFPDYIGHGHTILTIDGFHQIRDSNFRIVKQFDTLRYGLRKPDQIEDWMHSWPEVPPTIIIDSKEKKAGLIDYKGDWIVPCEWDWWPGIVYHHNTRWKRSAPKYAMTLTTDSIYHAYRDSTWHLVHLDRGILFTYPDTLEPVHPSFGYNKELGLVVAINKNYFINQVCVDIESDSVIVSDGKMLFLNPYLLHSYPKGIVDKHGHFYHFSKDGSLKEVEKTDVKFVEKPGLYSKRKIWVAANGEGASGIIDHNGKLITPFEYESGGTRLSLSNYDFCLMSKSDSIHHDITYYVDDVGRIVVGPAIIEFGGGSYEYSWMNSHNWMEESYENAMIAITYKDTNGYHKGYVDFIGNCFID